MARGGNCCQGVNGVHILDLSTNQPQAVDVHQPARVPLGKWSISGLHRTPVQSSVCPQQKCYRYFC